MLLAADRITDHDLESTRSGRRSASRSSPRPSTSCSTCVLGTNDDDTYTLRVTQRIARRSGERVGHGRAGDRLPRDRRAGAARAAAGDARRQRARRWRAGSPTAPPPGRVGDRPLLADRGQPGRDPARLERRHPRLPLGREGDGEAGRVLGAARLRGDRAAPLDRPRPARRRRREPRQPALGRGRPGDPDGQPDGRREAGEPGLPRLLRERLQRRPRAGAVLLGGPARVDRPPARRSAATSARAATAAASTRSCAPRSASSCAT